MSKSEIVSESSSGDTGGCSNLLLYVGVALGAFLLFGLCAAALGWYFLQDGGETAAATATPASSSTATQDVDVTTVEAPQPTVTPGIPVTAAIMTLPPTAAAIATNEAEPDTAPPDLLPTLAATNTPRPPASGPRNPITLLVYVSCAEGTIAEFTRNATINFEWNWEGQLAPGEFLEVRVGPQGSANLGGVGGQVDPNLRNGTRYRWPLPAGTFFLDGVTTYEWQVAYVGADGGPKTVSERGCLRIN